MKTRVTFASNWTSSDGETYKRGQTAEIDANDARSLIFRGRVRPAPEPVENDAPPLVPPVDSPVGIVDEAEVPVEQLAETPPIPDAARRRPRADTGTATAAVVPAKPSETKES